MVALYSQDFTTVLSGTASLITERVGVKRRTVDNRI
jgi:hypothetical protein